MNNNYLNKCFGEFRNKTMIKAPDGAEYITISIEDDDGSIYTIGEANLESALYNEETDEFDPLDITIAYYAHDNETVAEILTAITGVEH